MIKATIIADSINPQGNRLTTFVAEFPRIVLAEFNTHRMLSKNSASSRAIPFEKMLERVQNEPFIPMKWMMDHKGMQGNQYFDSMMAQEDLKKMWLRARDAAVEQAIALSEYNEIGLTKQIVNRLLEPFMMHTVIVTGTEWENFFALRAHEAAEIHIADLAEKMLVAYNESRPKALRTGDWHVPFGDKFDDLRIGKIVEQRFPEFWHENLDSVTLERLTDSAKVMIATARCARVSYMTFEGKDDYEADLKLHDRLKDQGHWSPFEHCAQARNNSDWSGNFRGFIQYRKTFLGENKRDPRVERYIVSEPS